MSTAKKTTKKAAKRSSGRKTTASKGKAPAKRPAKKRVAKKPEPAPEPEPTTVSRARLSTEELHERYAKPKRGEKFVPQQKAVLVCLSQTPGFAESRKALGIRCPSHNGVPTVIGREIVQVSRPLAEQLPQNLASRGLVVYDPTAKQIVLTPQGARVVLDEFSDGLTPAQKRKLQALARKRGGKK